MYFDENLSTTKIANIYGSSHNAVNLKLRRAGYILRGLSDSQLLNSLHITLTHELRERLDGLLLGDGCISLAPTKKSACYCHTDKHEEYILWLQNELLVLGFEGITIRKHSTQNCYSLRTRYYPELIDIRKRWYPNNKKQLPMDFKISPIALFDFYIGDGNYNKGKNNTKKGESVRIAMYFDSYGRLRLIDMLKKLGINATEQRKQIYIRADSRDKFFNYISIKKIPVSYQYKFPQGVII